MAELQFALDIGTRGVTGILYDQSDQRLCLRAVRIKEHADRAMQDGQIHDIDTVSRAISEVRRGLEEDCGHPLTHVSVAAAGRALCTIESSAATPLLGAPCSEEDVYNLQLVAVQLAKHKVSDQSSAMHCVGYHVRYFELDGAPIGSLIGQRGEEARVVLIATFLPSVVIHSLDRALTKAGLQMKGLTLEPIAAQNVLIPVSMRKLNIALVDIGAGTSDIALTNAGSVSAFGMTPMAGDEITEALATELLLDFPVAEQIKRQLCERKRVKATDILGNRISLSSKETTLRIASAISALADTIAAEILRLNYGKAPAAVMLIGGGAKTPGLPAFLAQSLQLSHDRVRLRDRASLTDITGCEDTLCGPESITPIGIAYTASVSEIMPITILVDDRSLRLFSFHPLTAGDALVEAGVDLRELRGRAGAALVTEINGSIRALPGTLGTVGTLRKNGQTVELGELLATGDVLQITRAVHGVEPRGVIGDLLSLEVQPRTISINDKPLRFVPAIYKNGASADLTTELRDRDVLSICYPTISEALREQYSAFEVWRTTVTVNEQTITLERRNWVMTPDLPLDTTLTEGLTLILQTVKVTAPTVADALLQCGLTAPFDKLATISVNGKLRHLQDHEQRLLRNGQVCQLNDSLVDGDHITCLQQSELNPIQLSSLLLDMGDELRLQAVSGGRLLLRKNGEEASFSTTVSDGDQIEIAWEHLIPMSRLEG